MKNRIGGGYMKIYRNLLYNPDLKPNDIVVYTIISDKCESAAAFKRLDKDGLLSMSISQIAELARLDRKTISKSLEKLEKMHLIAVYRNGKGNSIRVSALSPDDAAITIDTLCG